MSTVLVTGSGGFVGPFLVDELHNGDFETMTPNRSDFDILDVEGMRTYLTLQRPEYIVNLIAQSKTGASFLAFEETVSTNLYGTRNLLEVVREIENYKPRIFLVGSSEEHGLVTEDQLPLHELSAFNPGNPYGLSKMAAYYLSRQYIRNFGMDIVYICPFNNLGPGQQEGFLVPDICRQIVAIERGKQQPVLKVGNLSAKKDFTDVRDIAKGYALLVKLGQPGERYNLCSGRAVATQTIVDTLITLAGVPISLETDPAKFRPNETPVIYGSYKKTNALTGWKPNIPLETTLKDCLDFARNTVGVV